MPKEVIITNKEHEGKWEMYSDFYTCPECGGVHIFAHDNYCSNCGAKLVWNLEKEGD